jgi:hypothetical protein
MTSPPTPLAALDEAISAVRRLQAADLRTARGGSASRQLERLLDELAARRAEVAAGGTLDREWAGRTVRSVAQWLPDEELPLLARLGAIARARAEP